MARWNIQRGLETAELLRARWPERGEALWRKLALTEHELVAWRDAADRIVTLFDPATGLYEEFAGFHQLEHIDLTAYADRTQPIDVVIGRERTQRSQVVKQADVVALIGLLPEVFPNGSAEANFRYYEPRCAHGSSLSPGMHALVAARLGYTDMALHYLRRSAEADLDRDPNSAGGVRIAGLGAVWQAVVLGFAGLELAGDVPTLTPKLPPAWRGLSFRFCWRGRSVAIRIEGGIVQATLAAGDAMELRIDQTQHRLTAGTPLEVSLRQGGGR
jgi:trehalose/maltose hydrolase-like predicted phosphorylase